MRPRINKCRYWAGCSNYSERVQEKNTDMVSPEELKRMLDKYEINHAEVKHKRPRIEKAPKEVIVSVFGNQIKMSFTDYQRRGNGFTIVTKIW